MIVTGLGPKKLGRFILNLINGKFNAGTDRWLTEMSH
jgi:hypothetical protein